jgi:protein import protein ZIM17
VEQFYHVSRREHIRYHRPAAANICIPVLRLQASRSLVHTRFEGLRLFGERAEYRPPQNFDFNLRRLRCLVCPPSFTSSTIMLPSRLFRNTGLPPALRSLITPRASLPPTISVQLRLRLGVLNPEAAYSTAPPPPSAPASTPSPSTPPPSSAKQPSPSSTPPTGQSSTAAVVTGPQPVGEPIEPRLSMTFTCTVKDCGERSTHQFTKRAYERGIVLVQCPGCKNRCVLPSLTLHPPLRPFHNH